MPIVLGPAERKAISRRLVKLPTEINIFTMTSTNLDRAASAYTDVGLSNDQFLQFWIGITDAYLSERLYLTGETFNTFTFAQADIYPPYPDFTNPKLFGPPPIQDLFFPLGSTPPDAEDNFYLIPKISDYVTGAATGFAANWEELYAGIHHKMVEALVSGLGGGGGLLSTSCGAYSGGLTVLVTDATNIANKVLLWLYDAVAPTTGSYAVYVLSGGGVAGPSTLNVYPINGTGTIDAGIVYIQSAGIIWTDADRNAFPCAGTGAGAASVPGNSTLATFLSVFGLSDVWRPVLANEHVQLGLNEDSRPTQAAENAAALSSTSTDPGTISDAIATWLLLGVVGPGCMWNDAGLATLDAAVIVRQVEIAARSAQLSTALGSVTAGPTGTYVVTPGAIASRYQNLDRKINKSYGSDVQAINSEDTKALIDQQKVNAESALIDYSTVMISQALISEPDGSKTIFIQDITGFTPGDPIYVIDEDNVELTGYIIGIYESGRVDLNIEIPSTYTTDNLVRLYKTLI